jgi:DNA-binding transcriptional ArsR family regulator
MQPIVEVLLEAPDHHLDPSIKKLIEKWDETPTSLQILEVLDNVIHFGCASRIVVTVLQEMYDSRCNTELTTHDAVVKLATWRNEL